MSRLCVLFCILMDASQSGGLAEQGSARIGWCANRKCEKESVEKRESGQRNEWRKNEMKLCRRGFK